MAGDWPMISRGRWLRFKTALSCAFSLRSWRRSQAFSISTSSSASGNGLVRIVVRAQLHGLHGRLDRALAGEHDHFALGMRQLELLQSLHTRHARHYHVQHDDVKLPQTGQLQRLFAVGGLLHAKTATRESPRHRLAKIGVVINQKQINLMGIAGHGI